MVVGAGIAGMQAALDLANSGFYVHLVEKKASIGGVMAQLDKTFPTNDCSMCIMSPKLVECGRHLNIEMHTLSEVKGIERRTGQLLRSPWSSGPAISIWPNASPAASAPRNAPRKCPMNSTRGWANAKPPMCFIPRRCP